MSLNPSACASAINVAHNNSITSYPLSSFPLDFSNAYKAYSQGGTLSSGGGVSGSENGSTLSSFLSSFSSNTSDASFGQALADYWATCMLVPAGGAISVTNNAATKVAAFTAAITASYTNTESTPYFLNFITNIENVAKTIIWTVTLPDPPFIRTETIS